MSILNQIVPRLSRSLNRNEDDGAPRQEFTVKPAYRIAESADAWDLAAQLPGVAKDGLEVTAEEGQVAIRGRRAWQQPAGWTTLYRESYDAPFELTLEHDNTVDADQIKAELKDGVLRLTLPKAAALKPRKIAVN